MDPDRCARCGDFVTPNTIRDDRCSCDRRQERSLGNKRKRVPYSVMREWDELRMHRENRTGPSVMSFKGGHR